MKKRICQLISILLLVCVLSGCSLLDTVLAAVAPDSEAAGRLPHLMVREIDVSLHPWDPEFDRHYQTQENLTVILQMLREMVVSASPEEEPPVTDGLTYYAITATYANGEQRLYQLLSYQFLKVGDEDWCRVSYDQAMEFTAYLRGHPSDDGSYVPPATQPPAPTTAPTETVPPSTEAVA